MMLRSGLRLLAAVLTIAAAISSCHRSPQASEARNAQPQAAKPAVPAAAPQTNAAAAGSQSDAAPQGPKTRFSKRLAWAQLTKQLEFGNRVPGTPAHKACRKYLTDELLKSCDKVEQQQFSVRVQGKDIQMYNLIGRFGLDKPRRLLLCAHWDTRPTADQNAPGQRKQPIPGANDGASGVAVLLDLARVFHEQAPDVGVDIVLFDGEDYGPGFDMMFLGAKHFAEQLSDGQVRSYNYGVLLDMIGDKSLDVHPEDHSEGNCPLIYQVAQQINESIGLRSFKSHGGYTIFDDHLPLQDRGVKIYDFIDFNYPYWHTTEDTADKCSADSLDAIGRTLEIMVYKFPAIYGSV